MRHQDSNGDSVFHLMAVHGFVSLLKENLENYSKLIFTTNNHGQYPIHVSILNDQFLIAQVLSTVEDVSLLKDPFEQTPLHYAARYGNKEMVELCCHPKTLNALDTEGKTPVIWAVKTNNLEATQTLINHGADYSIKDYLGNSILHYATLTKNQELLNWILEHTTIDTIITT